MLYTVGTSIDLSRISINKEQPYGAKKSVSDFQTFFEKTAEFSPNEVSVGTQFKIDTVNGITQLQRVIPVSFA